VGATSENLKPPSADSLVGVLRLHSGFAARSRYSAQDDLAKTVERCYFRSRVWGLRQKTLSHRLPIRLQGSFDCIAASLREAAPPLRMTAGENYSGAGRTLHKLFPGAQFTQPLRGRIQSLVALAEGKPDLLGSVAGVVVKA